MYLRRFGAGIIGLKSESESISDQRFRGFFFQLKLIAFGSWREIGEGKVLMDPHSRHLSAAFLVTVSLCTLPLATEAADRLKVSLTVSAKDDIKNQAESYLRRELGGLHDVDIVERDPDLAVRIIVLEQTPQAGRKTGVALAMLVVMPFENAFVKNAAQDKYKETVGKVTDALFYSPNMFLRVGDELQKVCKDAIAGLDGDQFEDIRKTRRDIENALRPYRPREKK